MSHLRTNLHSLRNDTPDYLQRGLLSMLIETYTMTVCKSPTLMDHHMAVHRLYDLIPLTREEYQIELSKLIQSPLQSVAPKLPSSLSSYATAQMPPSSVASFASHPMNAPTAYHPYFGNHCTPIMQPLYQSYVPQTPRVLSNLRPPYMNAPPYMNGHPLHAAPSHNQSSVLNFASIPTPSVPTPPPLHNVSVRMSKYYGPPSVTSDISMASSRTTRTT